MTDAKRYLIISSYGSDCAERCYAPYIIGMTAAATGNDVTIFHMMDAAELGMQKVVDSVKGPPPMEPFKEIVSQAESIGVKVVVCEQSAKFRMIKNKDLRKGVTVADVLGMVNLIDEADRILNI